jgi:hypothetical protein
VDATSKPIVSRYAATRMQRRGIAPSVVDCLLEFGRERRICTV